MSYYDNSKEYDGRGIDYDLVAALEYNPDAGITVDQIDKVLAVVEGERDESDWRWILKLKKGAPAKFAFLQGGCDYTGWDCQSWAKAEFASTALKAAAYAKTGPGGVAIKDVAFGMGRMLSMLSGEYMKDANSVYDQLVAQLKAGKKKTWTEEMDDKLGTEDIPKIT